MYTDFLMKHYESMFKGYPENLTTSQMAEILNLKQETIYMMLKRQEIKGFKVSKYWRIPKANVIEFVVHQGENRK